LTHVSYLSSFVRDLQKRPAKKDLQKKDLLTVQRDKQKRQTDSFELKRPRNKTNEKTDDCPNRHTQKSHTDSFVQKRPTNKTYGMSKETHK